MNVSAQKLEAFCIQAMTKCGMNPADAQATAEVLVGTELLGVHTHGTKLLRGYLKRMKAGGLDPHAVPEVVKEGPSFAIVDGHSAMAMITSRKAMTVAIEKAKTSGIAYVGVKNSCHFGAAGAYALMAARENMIGLSMSNDVPSMTVPGARSHVLGTNPFAIAIPAGKEKPILLDIAMSTVAGSKVYQAVSQGKPIPNNWIVDQDGLPTTDGKCYPESASMLPMSGHKGYGLALMVETFSGLLTGGLIRNEVGSWIFGDQSKPTGHAHGFIVINPGVIFSTEFFNKRVDEMIRDIRSAPKAKGSDRIYLPGEMEWDRYENYSKNGIPLPEDVVKNLVDMAGDVGIPFTLK